MCGASRIALPEETMARRRTSKPDREDRGRNQVARRLLELIEARGYSVSRLERDMDLGRGYVSEALRGGKKLTVELIVEILAALDVKLDEIFAMRRTRHLDPPQEATPELPTAMRDDSPLLQAVVMTLAAKGLVSLEEVENRRRELFGTSAED